MLQPLSVRRTPTGWELVAGERRLRAARLAGLAAVPCLPVEADGDTSALLALVENLQRKDLDVWEEAAALRRLVDRERARLAAGPSRWRRLLFRYAWGRPPHPAPESPQT